MNTDREDYGGPAIIPSSAQLTSLVASQSSTRDPEMEVTTYPEAMAGVPRSILLSWESKTAWARRRRERDTAVETEVLTLECERCGAGRGDQCVTGKGWPAEKPHIGRQREAEANVDARLGFEDFPVAVPDV